MSDEERAEARQKLKENAKYRVKFVIHPVTASRGTKVYLNDKYQGTGTFEKVMSWQKNLVLTIQNDEILLDPISGNHKRWRLNEKGKLNLSLNPWEEQNITINLEEWVPGRIERASIPVKYKMGTYWNAYTRPGWFGTKIETKEKKAGRVINEEECINALIAEGLSRQEAKKLVDKISSRNRTIRFEKKIPGYWKKAAKNVKI